MLSSVVFEWMAIDGMMQSDAVVIFSKQQSYGWSVHERLSVLWATQHWPTGHVTFIVRYLTYLYSFVKTSLYNFACPFDCSFTPQLRVSLHSSSDWLICLDKMRANMWSWITIMTFRWKIKHCMGKKMNDNFIHSSRILVKIPSIKSLKLSFFSSLLTIVCLGGIHTIIYVCRTNIIIFCKVHRIFTVKYTKYSQLHRLGGIYDMGLLLQFICYKLGYQVLPLKL